MKCPECGKGEVVAILEENLDCLMAIAMKNLDVKCDYCGWKSSIKIVPAKPKNNNPKPF